MEYTKDEWSEIVALSGWVRLTGDYVLMDGVFTLAAMEAILYALKYEREWFEVANFTIE